MEWEEHYVNAVVFSSNFWGAPQKKLCVFCGHWKCPRKGSWWFLTNKWGLLTASQHCWIRSYVSKPTCKSSQILSQWKPWSNKNIVRQMPPGWLIIGILSFLLKGKLCIFLVKCCLTWEQECCGVGSWNLFSGSFVKDFLFILLFYWGGREVLIKKCIKSLLSQKTV